MKRTYIPTFFQIGSKERLVKYVKYKVSLFSFLFFPDSPTEETLLADFDAVSQITRNHAKLCLLGVCTMTDRIYAVKFIPKPSKGCVVTGYAISSNLGGN